MIYTIQGIYIFTFDYLLTAYSTDIHIAFVLCSYSFVKDFLIYILFVMLCVNIFPLKIEYSVGSWQIMDHKLDYYFIFIIFFIFKFLYNFFSVHYKLNNLFIFIIFFIFNVFFMYFLVHKLNYYFIFIIIFIFKFLYIF